jgi:putative ABC transport system permease protein
MFKNMLKRAWLSTTRKPGKSILVGLILFAMANLVLATITINRAVSEQTEYAKESLGGTVYLQPDMETLHDKMMSSMEASGAAQAGPVRITRPTVPVTTAIEIAKSAYVKDYSYALSARAAASNFTPVAQSNNFPGGGGGYRVRADETTTTLTADITLESANAYAFLPAVSSNLLSYEGNYFDESTKNGAMISQELALAANLALDDEIALKNIYTESEITLKIIGIYTNSSDNFDENTIYTNTATAAEFLEEKTDNFGVQSVSYYMLNAEDSDAFIAEINAKYPTLKADGLILDIDTSAYDQMVGPITSVGSFATTILVIVIIASLVIITLIVMLNIRERRYEMGVLLSLGASKLNIVGQIATELVIVGTVFFALSTLTSTALAKNMGQGLLESQIANTEKTSEQNFGRGNHASHGDMINGMRTALLGATETADTEPISEIDISTDAGTYALLFALGYGVLLFALILPSINILRYQPKQILTGKE